MADIFDELKEDMRAEQTRRVLRKAAIPAGLVVLAALAGVGGWEYWRSTQGAQVDGAATAFVQAMRASDAMPQDAKPEERTRFADQFSQLATPDTPPAYRTLARLRAAALLSDAGDAAGAAAAWQSIADDGTADRALRDLASLLWVQHQLDSADPAQLQSRLAPLTAPESPWHTLASEAEAWLDLRLGKTDEAKSRLRTLAADTSAPDGLRGRANGLLQVLGDKDARG